MTTRARSSQSPAPVTRPRRKSASDIARRQETLAEFTAALSEHAGQLVPFMSSVVELTQTRAAVKLLKERRALIFEQIKRHYASGVTITSNGETVLRTSRPAPMVTVRTVESDTVKRRYPKVWQANRIAVPRVAVTAPTTYWLEVPVPKLPAVPAPSASLDRCVAAYRNRAFDRFESLRRDETVLISRLTSIADDYGWDGLPIAFADGWTVGLASLRFDAETLRQAAPDVFEELAVDKTRGGSTRLYLARPGDDDESFEDFAE